MSKSKPLPSVERVRELLSYDPETGELRWRVSRCKARAGAVAGTLTSSGYRTICLDGQTLKAHRLAWLLAHGEDPGSLEIDHKNGDKSDNRLANLRLATRKQNGGNVGTIATNTSGFGGVYWHKQRSKWRSQIRHNGRRISLGLFVTPEEAHAAYVAAAEQLRGEFARSA